MYTLPLTELLNSSNPELVSQRLLEISNELLGTIENSNLCSYSNPLEAVKLFKSLELHKAQIYSAIKLQEDHNYKAEIARRLSYLTSVCASFSSKFAILQDLLQKEINEESLDLVKIIQKDGIQNFWLLVKDIRVRRSKYACKLNLAPLMVQDFSEIKDKRILVYYSQIIFESIGIDFTTEQKTNFLKLHGFDSNQIPEILQLGEELNQRLDQFRLNLQNQIYLSQLEDEAGQNPLISDQMEHEPSDVDSLTKQLNLLGKNLECSTFCIITGTEFSGKTALLDAHLSRSKVTKFIRLYVTKSLDLKTLVGTYVCSERLGEFEWKDGPLAAAYKQGYLLILENLESAKDEFYQMINNSIEGALEIRGSKKSPKHPNFKIIGTWQTSSPDEHQSVMRIINTKPYISNLHLESLSQDVVIEGFKNLTQCNPILEVLKKLHNFSSNYFAQQKNHCLTSTVLELQRLCERFSYTFEQVYGERIPQSLSVQFKMLLIQAYIEIYFGALREELPGYIFQNLGDIFELIPKEIQSYLENYDAKINIDQETRKFTSTRLPRTFFSHKSTFEIFEEKGSKTEKTLAQKLEEQDSDAKKYITTKYSRNLVERIMYNLNFGANLLLVGRTGCGKTTAVQETAKLLGKKLYVYNMSQSSDVSDLLGGFKPMDSKSYLVEHFNKFVDILKASGRFEDNRQFIKFFKQLLDKNELVSAIKYLLKATEGLSAKIEIHAKDQISDQSIAEHSESLKSLLKKLKMMFKMREKLQNKLIFKYIKGDLVNALKKGDWILLDEVNLAEPEILNVLSPLFENKSISLIDKGKLQEVQRHPDFRIISCMNPGNSVGKKELQGSNRKRFVEFFVPELTDPVELEKIVMNRSKLQFKQTESELMTQIYLRLRDLTEAHQIEDGFGRKPTFTLRALCRAVDVSSASKRLYGGHKERTLVDGILASFGSNLDERSHVKLLKELDDILQVNHQAYDKLVHDSRNNQLQGYINILGFFLKIGPYKSQIQETNTFLLTDTVKIILKDLLRVICHSEFPILLEGPTSAGKTSIIKYIAEISGNKVVRINNHQHTDLDEYVGTYSPDTTGKLVFKQGLLVEAMTHGYWLILDEINLAKSEILEALNRLLDDNRELYIPEINRLVKPHPDFRIFATQNPLTYGGRKELSAAFRSRFVHFYLRDLHFNDLITIIMARCELPQTRAKTLVEVMETLKMVRSRQNFFAGKESLITIRDLLKWGSRDVVDYENMAVEGIQILVERLRHHEEKEIVKGIIEKICNKGAVIDPSEHYKIYANRILGNLGFLDEFGKPKLPESSSKIYWSDNFIRMFSLTFRCLEFHEPVLLIGETGCGKTTLAQLIAEMMQIPLYMVNCHQYTESSDFIGSIRPLRNKDKTIEELDELIKAFEGPEQVQKILIQWKDSRYSKKAEQITEELRILGTSSEDIELQSFLEKSEDLKHVQDKSLKLEQVFEWIDGPLVSCMKNGGVLLIDEISLAQDSVLERLNSVLEREKTLTLSEKGDGSVIELVAHPKCIIIATMNPSGDFGKRELTPALRNRFTEIWVEPITAPAYLNQSENDLMSENFDFISAESFEVKNDLWQFVKDETTELITKQEAEIELKPLAMSTRQYSNLVATLLYRIVHDFNRDFKTKLKPLTLRDLKSTLKFLVFNLANIDWQRFSQYLWILLGGFYCLDFEVTQEAHQALLLIVVGSLKKLENFKNVNLNFMNDLNEVIENESNFGFEGFLLPKKTHSHFYNNPSYNVSQRAVSTNLQRIIHAICIEKSILLEGPPGVGKTSLVEYLAKKLDIPLYRVNLSEQTDLIDLLGSDVPSDSSSAFKWADGVLLKAMKEGAWLLLDELNMASQTVLEGLNSILDHRGSIYLPELDKTVEKSSGFRIFASQNPTSMGSGRKGLPHSFLTRFTRIWLEAYTESELKQIIYNLYPEMSSGPLKKLLQFFFQLKDHFNSQIARHDQTTWEFNLRDLHLMFELMGDISQEATVEKVTEILVSTLLYRLPIQHHNYFYQLYSKIFKQPLSFVLRSRIDSSSQIAFPSSLNNKSLRNLLPIIHAPIAQALDSLKNSDHPIMFILSEEVQDMVNVQEFLEVLVEEKNRQQVDSEGLLEFSTMDLFDSSDVVDLIGGFVLSAGEDADQDKLFSSNGTNISSLGQIPRTDADQETPVSIFSWKESSLVTAIRNGQWILLRGIESVNSGVLERLNGILEKEKVIWLNESLSEKLDDKMLVKHPRFRVFLEFNEDKSSKGPSRALRNRCIELRIDNFMVRAEQPGEPHKIIKLPENQLNSEEQQYQQIVRCIDQNLGQDIQSLEKFNLFERLFCNQGYISSFLPTQHNSYSEKSFRNICYLTITQNTLLRKFIYQSSNFLDISKDPQESIKPISEERALELSAKSLVDKNALVSKNVQLILGNLVEMLLKKVNLQTVSQIESKFTDLTSIKAEILGFLDDNLSEALSDEIEVILGSNDEYRLSFRLLIQILSQSKFTYRSQSSVLVKLFSDMVKKNSQNHNAEAIKTFSPQNQIEMIDHRPIQSPVHFLLTCIRMLTYSESTTLLQKFIHTENTKTFSLSDKQKSRKSSSSTHASDNSVPTKEKINTVLSSLLREETMLKLRVLRNTRFEPDSLDSSILAKMTSLFESRHDDQSTSINYHSIEEFVGILEKEIRVKFEEFKTCFLDQFLIFEAKEEFGADHEVIDKVLYMPFAQKKEGSSSKANSLSDNMGHIDLFENLIDGEKIRQCVEYVNTEFVASKKISSPISNLLEFLSISPSRGQLSFSRLEFLKQQLTGFWAGNSTEIQSISEICQEAESSFLIETIKKWETTDFSGVRISEIGLLKEQLQLIQSLGKSDAENLLSPIAQENFKKESYPAVSTNLNDEIASFRESLRTYAESMVFKTDVISKTNAIEAFSKMTIIERELLVKRIEMLNRHGFESILSRQTSLAIKQLCDCLRNISDTLQSKKIRMITIEDLREFSTLEHSTATQKNPTKFEVLTLSEQIGQIVQTSFFNSSSNISQTSLDLLTQILEFLNKTAALPTLNLVSLKKAHSEYLDLVLAIFRSILASGDLVIFSDSLVPLMDKIWSFCTVIRTHLSRVTEIKQELLESDEIQAQNMTSKLKKLMQTEKKILNISTQLHDKTAIGKGAALDEASKLVNLQRNLENVINDEYTKEQVLENRIREREEIRDLFGLDDLDTNFEREFKKLTQEEIQIRELQKNKRAEALAYIEKIWIEDYLGVFGVEDEKYSDKIKKTESIAELISNEESSVGLELSGKNSKNLRKLAFQRIDQRLQGALGGKVVEMTSLSIFAKVSQINSTTEMIGIWKEQLQQLIEVDSRGFYKGCDKEEIIASQQIISKLLVSLQQRKSDPEIGTLPLLNSVLGEVSNYLNAIMEQTSLNKAADRLQKIISLINDFEVLVPKKFHFEEKVDLIDCLSRWRKKERKMWRSMLSIQNLDIIIEDLITCIKFKHALVSTILKSASEDRLDEMAEEESSTTLLSIVEDFLRGCELFQFINRVAWVQLLVSYLHTLRPEVINQRLLTIVEQIVAYYGNWMAFALSQYKNLFADVDRPIREVEKLSNWHMKDFVNLQMNISKYYKGLNRTMKSHLEILKHNTPIIVIEAKRKQQLFENEQMIVSKLQDSGFDYQGDFEIYEFVERVEEENDETKLAKILEKVDNPYGWKKKRDAEKQPDQVVKDIPKKIIKTLNKKHIDEFVEKYLRFHPEVDPRVIQLLVKELRIVDPLSWILRFLPELVDAPTTRNEKSTTLADLASNKNLKICYNEYQTALQMIDEDIDSWFSSLVEMQDSKSRTQRNRVLGDFLKTLKSYGFNQNTRIQTFSSIKLFEKMTGVRETFIALQKEELGLHEVFRSSEKINMLFTRYYEVVDMLMTQKTDGKYHQDVEDVIRLRMQGIAVSMANDLSTQIYHVSYIINLCQRAQKLSDQISDFKNNIKNCSGLESILKEHKNAIKRCQMAEGFKNTNYQNFHSLVTTVQAFVDGGLDLAVFQSRINDHPCLDLFRSSLENIGLFTKEEKKTMDEECVVEAKKIILKFQSLMKKYDELMSDEDHHYFRNQKEGLKQISNFVSNSSKSLLKLKPFYPKGLSYFKLIVQIFEIVKVHSIGWLNSYTKFTFFTTTVFHNLIYKGFCAKEEPEQEQKQGEDEYNFGTGVGEGQGDNDATENYDFEEQLLGEQGQKPDDGDDQDQNDDGDQDAGMEMENDFDGKNFDMDKDKQQEEKTEKEIEDAFDQVDQDDMDKKLWNEENEEMDEEDQEDREGLDEDEPQDLRDDQDVEFKGDKKDETEQKAKEFEDKQQRKADEDYQQNSENDEQDDDKNPEDQENNQEEKEGEKDEYAEVESVSSMSEREVDENMDFDEDKMQEEEKIDEDATDQQEEKSMDDVKEDGIMPEEYEDSEEQPLEDFEDPLMQEERKMKEELDNQSQNEDALSEKGADQNEMAEEEANQNEMQVEENDELGAKQQGEQPQKKDEEEPQGQEADEEKTKKENDEDAKQNNKDLLKEEKKPDLNREKLEQLMENLLVMQNKDSEREPPKEMDNFDAIEQADDDDEFAFNLMAPLGMNMDSKKEKQQEDAPDKKPENPVMKMPDNFTNTMEEEPENQQNDENKKDGDDQEAKKKSEELEEDEENMTGKREKMDESALEDEYDPIKKLKLTEHTNPELGNNNYDKEQLVDWMKAISHVDPSKTSNKNQQEIWNKLESSLTDKAYYLSEELRNIFKPTKISGMKGDYRTGKRINMRKVISYVASNYRKDKIWLRRSDPSQKDYQIILAIDDSLSMNEKNVGYFALEALTTFAIALNKLEVGEIMIAAIRSGMTELHPFNKPFSPSEGPKLISNMGFDFSNQLSADFGLAKFMRESIDAFGKDERHKICFIISDGRFNKDIVRPFCLESEEVGILYIYIILDSSDGKSILNYKTSKVEKVDGKSKVLITNYLEDFPFRNYIIVRDMKELTGIIASIMRDYFMKMDMQDRSDDSQRNKNTNPNLTYQI